MEINFQRGLHRHLRGFIKSQVWGYTPVVLAVRRLRQEDGEIKNSLDNTAKSNLKRGGGYYLLAFKVVMFPVSQPLYGSFPAVTLQRPVTSLSL